MTTSHDVSTRLPEVPEWSRDGETIRRTFTFKNFSESLDFVNRVGALAEQTNHHPDVDIRWNKVTLTLSTHSKNQLTSADVDLAGKIDALLR